MKMFLLDVTPSRASVPSVASSAVLVQQCSFSSARSAQPARAKSSAGLGEPASQDLVISARCSSGLTLRAWVPGKSHEYVTSAHQVGCEARQSPGPGRSSAARPTGTAVPGPFQAAGPERGNDGNLCRDSRCCRRCSGCNSGDCPGAGADRVCPVFPVNVDGHLVESIQGTPVSCVLGFGSAG